MATNLFSNKQPSQHEVQGVINLLNQGSHREVVKMAESLLANYPSAFILHNLLGISLDALGSHAEAIDAYRKAAQIQNNNPDLHFNLAIALTHAGKLDESIHSYRTAIRLNPHFFEAYGNLGTVLQKQGRLEEAVASYRKAISIHPDPLGYFNLGTALRDEGKLEEAIHSYREAIKLYPNYADAYCNLGETYRDQGNMPEAIKFYQQALAINPDHPQANYDMAEFLYLAKKYDEAIPHFTRSQIDDWQERSMYCLYKAERFDEFKEKLDHIVKTTAHTAPFIATLSTHYAVNFGVEDPYNFCKNGFDFVYNEFIPELAEPNSPLLAELIHDIETTEIAARAQGMLHFGKQSAGNLFKRPETSFRTLGELVKKEFAKYREKFKDADCELIKSFPNPDNFEFTSSWYVRMRQGGHIDQHIHEIGWISGAVYLKMPQNKKDPYEGGFEYGIHGDNYPQKHSNFPTGIVMPQAGQIVLFPSSLFHRTIPFSADEERICVAFDLKPAVPTHARSSY
jgi:uncharacterized protein (TIGR02466 family)